MLVEHDEGKMVLAELACDEETSCLVLLLGVEDGRNRDRSGVD